MSTENGVTKGMMIAIGSWSFAAASHSTFAQRYSFVRDISPEDWNLVIGAAGSVVALLHDRRATESQQERHLLVSEVKRELLKLDSRGAEAIDDCFEFLGKSFSTVTDAEALSTDAELLLGDSVGFWSVSQMLSRYADSEDERTLARELGLALRIGWPREK